MDKRPTKPARKCPSFRRHPAVRDAAISAEIDAHLAAAASTTPPPISPDDLRDAADLIAAAADMIPPPTSPPAAAGLAGLAATGSTDLCTISAPTTAPTDPDTIRDPTIRDSDGFLAWVAARPATRTRVARYLALASRTGKLASTMTDAGITVGLLAALQQRHPIIRAALDMVRLHGTRRLVSRASEVIDSIMDAPDDQALQLKAASTALQYSSKASADTPHGADAGPGGVQIVINLGQQPAQPRRIAADDVRTVDQDAIFIAGGGK